MNEQEPATIGGYRVVRKLGEGPRAEVFLGYPVREGSAEPPAALKVYRAHVDQPAILRELEALSRAAGPHVVGFRDISLGRSSAVILDRLARGGLSRLLAEREGLRTGEAITILVPLLEAVSRMHSAGCVHGAVGPERVLFTTDGAPVLVGFGSSALLSPGLPPARLAEHEGVAADLQALASLAGNVLARVDDRRALQLADWASERGPREHDGWCAQLTARLFDLGDAAPIEFDVDPTVVPATLGRVVAPLASDDDHAKKIRLSEFAVALPEWLDPLVGRVLGRVSPVVERLTAAVRVVRPAIWVAAATVAVALTAAVALVPSESSDAALGPVPTATPIAGGDAGGDSSSEAVMADDPIAAAVVLLEVRDQCFRELSVICLDSVAQQGSGALAVDQATMRDAQNGAELPSPFVVGPERLSIVEEVGDAVLLEWADPAHNEPASLLLMKGEAGWRIRDYLSQ